LQKTKTKHLSLKRTHKVRPTPWWPPWPTGVAQSRAPTSRLRLARGLTPPSSGSALLKGSRLPRASSASLEGSSPPRSRPPREHTRSRAWVRAFNALTQQSCGIMRLGITPRHCSANSLGGNPSPPLWGTVRHGQCQLRGTVPPTPVRLTRRALEGGPAAPSNHFLVNLQGQAMTLGRRDAIPATVDHVRPPPCLQHHAGHCYNNLDVVGHAGTARRHACRAYSPGTHARKDEDGLLLELPCNPTRTCTV
jgi:hypothetical protein